MRWLDRLLAPPSAEWECAEPGCGHPESEHDHDGCRACEPRVIIAERPGCVDIEDYARIHNEGYALAVAHGLVDDPTEAEEWLRRHVASLVDVEPFRLLLANVEDQSRATGGGTSAAYADVATRLRHILDAYTPRQ